MDSPSGEHSSGKTGHSVLAERRGAIALSAAIAAAAALVVIGYPLVKLVMSILFPICLLNTIGIHSARCAAVRVAPPHSQKGI